ncbi:MAG: GTP cyclohydrolase I, partial [Spirochaetota bacterium]
MTTSLPAPRTNGAQPHLDEEAELLAADRAEGAAASQRRVRHITGIEPSRTFDHDKIEQAVRMLFEAIGEDPDRPGIADTPARVAREFDEIFAGLLIDPAEVLSVSF